MTFSHFLIEVVKPMFPGTTVEPSRHESTRNSPNVVVFVSPVKLRVRENTDTPEWFEVSRRQSFDASDKQLVTDLVEVYGDVKRDAAPLLRELEDAIARKVVARNLARSESVQNETVASILAVVSNWATQTYEGTRVSCGVLVTNEVSNNADFKFESLSKEDFGKAISDGVDSWWIVGAHGQILGFETTENENTPLVEAYFPLRYRALALKSAGNSIGITLNRNGEILVFADQRLQFAKRRGIWVHFDHNSVVTQMSGGGAGAIALRKAIYESCLDASFARSGGCIGLLRRRTIEEFQQRTVVAPDDQLSSSKLKPKACRALVRQRLFQNIPRSIRKEMMKLDGAIILEPNGRVLAVGAILKIGQIDLGNQGGRSAAAKTLSTYGLGIKVSEDGMITGYKQELGNELPAFKIG